MDVNQLPFAEFAHLIEFITCFAGTSAPVERIFANVNKIWTKEKSALQPSTLKSNNRIFYKKLRLKKSMISKIHKQMLKKVLVPCLLTQIQKIIAFLLFSCVFTE
jgi:hypothetical protein